MTEEIYSVVGYSDDCVFILNPIYFEGRQTDRAPIP